MSDADYTVRADLTKLSAQSLSGGQGWQPISEVTGFWGHWMIELDGVDVTYYRDIPCHVRSISWSEPYGPAGIEIEFPQITPYEALPSWCGPDKNIRIWHVLHNGTLDVSAGPAWEGISVSNNDAEAEENFPHTVTGVGALYQVDDYQKQPAFNDENLDIGVRIARELNSRIIDGALRLQVCPEVTMGINSRNRGSWTPLLTGYIQDLLAMAWTDNGNQWTLTLDPYRQPAVRLKNRTTVHATVMNSTPGVVCSLTRDLSQAYNTFYGEGVDEENQRWRNSKYPNLRSDDAPVFGGTLLTLGVSNSDVGLWRTEMRSNGYRPGSSGPYNTADRDACMLLQQAAGIQLDGVVGPQTWAATFDVGSNGGDLRGAFFQPLAWDPAVEAFLYNANGQIIGRNPSWLQNKVRREVYRSYGERIAKWQGVRSATLEYGHTADPGWVGTITLTQDPQEVSRFDLRAGHNLRLRSHHGVDRLFHISGVNMDFDEMSVELTVDEHATDFMTLADIIERNKASNDPVRRPREYFRSSRMVEDKIAVWDSENGSGIIQRHATYTGLWNVIRIPVAELGTIIRAEFFLDVPARFSVAIFDRPITANTLASYGFPLDPGYWDLAESGFDPDALGCVMAWGQSDDAAGFYPLRENDEDSDLTGAMIDNGSWYYETTQPPWLWVAEWVEDPDVNYIHGRFYQMVNE